MEERLGIVVRGDEERIGLELQRQWRLVQSDEATRAAVAAKGIDLDTLDEIGPSPFIAKSASEGNRADVATAILIGIGIKVGSDLAHRVLLEFWERVLKPQLEKQFGNLTDERPD